MLLTGSRTTLGGLYAGAATRSWFGSRRCLKWSLAIVLLIAAVAYLGNFGSFRKRVSETMQP